MFRIFQNPCLGSFRCFWDQLFPPYQRSPPRRAACPGRWPNQHIRMTLSTGTFSAATAGVGQLGLERSGKRPSGNCQGLSIDPRRLWRAARAELAAALWGHCCPAVPPALRRVPPACPHPGCCSSACPPALRGWSKDRKTSKELELSLFSLSKVYINIFIGNRSLTSVFQFSKR